MTPKILVVDDTPSNILALEAALNDCSVEIVKAASGSDALKLVLSHNFALILLDVVMPGMNGYEVATILRSSIRTREIPIIFLSGAHLEKEDVFRGYESGAVDYILKPLNMAILRSKVRVFAELFLLKEENMERIAQQERVKFEEEKRQILESENAKLKAVLENMMMTVAMFDASASEPLFINRKPEWMNHFDPNQVFKKDGTRLPPENQALARALQGEIIYEEETSCRLRDGTQKDFLVGATPIREKGGAVASVVVSFLDISARVQAEDARASAQQQLLQANKMAALGEMASGIAHEVNSPMAIIAGKARQLHEELAEKHGDDEDLMQFASAIEETSHRIIKIVNGLRTHSRSTERDSFVSASVTSIIDGTLAICASRFKYSDVPLQVESGNSDLAITCRPAEISQVLLNLVGNALDAIENLPEKWIKIRAEAKDGKVQISVEDSGPGIPPSLCDKILEPFFTTKEVGKGTGLGLSISKSIVESHGGRIFIDKQAGHTRFVIQLPKAG